MIRISKSNSFLISKISSETSMVNRLIQETETFIRRFKIRNSIDLMIVLREVLLNAVIHGNNNIPERTVKCRIDKLEKNRFKIEVEDEGNGFDYRYLDMEIPEDPRHIRKRGYVIISALSDRIEFNSKGNRVTVYMGVNLRKKG